MILSVGLDILSFEQHRHLPVKITNSSYTMAGSTSQKPGVLMLGIVHHAKAEFEKLSEVADVVVCS